MTTLHRLATRLGLPLDLVLETWSERAAIRQFLGGYTRDEAERLAVADTEEMLGEEKR